MEKEWHKIIAFNGSQERAFEEMVCQIAMEEKNGDFRHFERVGTPDGGVECYWELSDGTEWGWQAKFTYITPKSQTEKNHNKETSPGRISIQNQLYTLFLTLFTFKVHDGLSIITIHPTWSAEPNTSIVSFQKPQKS